ncbi:MAG: ion channel [Novosphingobium sp.]
MPIFQTLWQRLYMAIARLSWSVFVACFVFHAALSYLVLWIAGETKLTDDPVTFLYFYMTTATTVGYGDLSPGDRTGRLVAILLVLPGSITLFTAFLGKAIAGMSGYWRRRLQGMGDYSDRAGHTLVIGWQGPRTRSLIEGLIEDDRGGRPVLLASGLPENPMPKHVDFVLAEGVSSAACYTRAGAAGAATVVIRGIDDDETLAATLAARAAAPGAHIVAHFQDEGAARLIRNQFPTIEVITSIAAELLVRSARDPGASRLAALMFGGRDDTAFSLRLPPRAGTIRYLDAFCGLKQRHGITLIGLAGNDGKVDLNCAADCQLKPGDILYYIADCRCAVDDLDWAALGGVQ